MWYVLENTSVRVLPPIVVHLVGNVFPESAILCVILSSREDPLHTYMYIHVCISKLYKWSSLGVQP